jgi:hypothetical protein
MGQPALVGLELDARAREGGVARRERSTPEHPPLLKNYPVPSRDLTACQFGRQAHRMHARLLRAVLLLAAETLAASPADASFYQVPELPPDCSKTDVRRNMQQSAFGMRHVRTRLTRAGGLPALTRLCVSRVSPTTFARPGPMRRSEAAAARSNAVHPVATASQRVTTRHRGAVGAGLNGVSVTAV